MTTRTLASNQPKADSPGSAPTGGLPHPVALGLVSGSALWLSFPPAEWSGAAWFALVPLFLLVLSKRSNASVYLGAWVGGFVFWLLAIHWIWWTDETAWLGWVVMAAFLSLWWPTFLFLARFSQRRLNLPLIVTAPLLWVALEYIRAYVLTGFPWYYLAHSQYRLVYFTQIADFSGALGLSFLIVDGQRLLGGPAELAHLPEEGGRLVVGPADAPATGSAGRGGAWRSGDSGLRRFPAPLERISDRGLGSRCSRRARSSATTASRSRPRNCGRFTNHSIRQAVASTPRPDLIVWPETSIPWSFVKIDPKLPTNVLDRQGKEVYSRLDRRPTGPGTATGSPRITPTWCKRSRLPMMVGSSLYQFQEPGYSKFNAAILHQVGLPIQVYHKLHLVPFGEYVPLLETFPWLIRLTPYRGTRLHFLDHGSAPSWFELGPYRLATAICFEDTRAPPGPSVLRRGPRRPTAGPPGQPLERRLVPRHL